MTAEEYFGDWTNMLDIQEADRILRKLSASKSIICPKIKDIFKAFHLCPLHNLRIVILGQDPYNTLHKPFSVNEGSAFVPTATGIAFGNSPDTPESSYSPSLEILRDSVIDFSLPHQQIIFDPSLEKWEEQGVLLLNSALSCEAHKPQSHALMWRPFIGAFLEKLSKKIPGIVYVLMGSAAISFQQYINKRNNHVLTTKHPSWYARNKTKMPPDIWKEIDNILIGQNGYGIQWYNEIKT